MSELTLMDTNKAEGVAAGLPSGVPERFERALAAMLGQTVHGGHRVTILRNGVEIFPALWDAIGSAAHSLDVCCFEVDGGAIPERLTELLCDRAQAGVRVRVLFDPLGGRKFRDEWVDALTECGVHFQWHDKRHRARVGLQNYRFHRRVVLCDQRIGFAGGFGFADRWHGDANAPDEYRDYAVRVEGPAVAGLRAGFVEGWAANGHPVLDEHDRFDDPGSPGSIRALCVRAPMSPIWNDAATVYETLLRTAETRVRMGMGYFSPAGRLVELLVETAQRGVQVDLVVPGPIMRRRISKWAGEAVFDELLDGGVNIYRFQPSRLHGKYVTVDGQAAVIGSANLDDRSLSLDAESSVVLFDRELTRQVDDDFDDDIRRSEVVIKGEWRSWGALEKVRDGVSRAFNPWI